jgi:uncharacterized protein (TIGR00251 family)
MTEGEGGVRLRVRLQPRSSRNKIGEVVADELRVHVTAPPVDSAANAALELLLAEAAGLARSHVQIIRGTTSRHKTVFLSGLDSASLRRRLGLE